MAIEGCTKFEVGDVNMNIIEVNERTQDLIQQLLMVWEKSVRGNEMWNSLNKLCYGEISKLAFANTLETFSNTER